MNVSRILKTAILGVALLAGSATVPWAACASSQETYTIFHCGNRAYFEPVPGGLEIVPGSVPPVVSNLTAVFWQFGFANTNINTGNDYYGTGFSSKAFNGNDSGNFPVNILDAAGAFAGEGFPADSVCLGSNDWSNSGVDGCCDNKRLASNFSYFNNYSGYGPYSYPADDNILNPYFGFFQSAQSFPGYYSLASIQDYPTAFLLKTANDAYFAVAAVASMDRNNTGGGENGACNIYSPGTNPAPCDVRQGFFNLGDVVNGNENAIPSQAGKFNAVPWQEARPREVSGLNCSVPGTCTGTLPVQFEVPCVQIYSDETVRPTNNPSMATRDVTKPRDATRAAGVGVRDLKKKWAGMVRYTLESAPINTDPNFGPVNVDPNGNVLYDTLAFTAFSTLTPSLDGNGNCTGPIRMPPTGTMDIDSKTCWRTRIDIGKAQEPFTVNVVNCRLGKCGDQGLSILPTASSGVTCFGGRDPLVSENIINASVARAKGGNAITWQTTAELSVTGFDVFAVTRQGTKLVATVPCTECSTGAGASYRAVVRQGSIQGRLSAFEIRMKGGSGAVANVPVQ